MGSQKKNDSKPFVNFVRYMTLGALYVQIGLSIKQKKNVSK